MPAATLPALAAAEVASAKTFIAEQLADATRRAYVADAQIFAAWCALGRPEVVATFLAVAATQQRGSDVTIWYERVYRSRIKSC